MVRLGSVRRSLLGFAVFVAMQAPGASRAAPSPPSAKIEKDIELAGLVDLCAEKLELTIKYEPGQLTGAVPLREGRSDLELWALTSQALVSRGFTTIQKPGEAALTVVKLDEASGLARLEEEDLSGPGRGMSRSCIGSGTRRRRTCFPRSRRRCRDLPGWLRRSERPTRSCSPTCAPTSTRCFSS